MAGEGIIHGGLDWAKIVAQDLSSVIVRFLVYEMAKFYLCSCWTYILPRLMDICLLSGLSSSFQMKDTSKIRDKSAYPYQ